MPSVAPKCVARSVVVVVGLLLLLEGPVKDVEHQQPFDDPFKTNTNRNAKTYTNTSTSCRGRSE